MTLHFSRISTAFSFSMISLMVLSNYAYSQATENVGSDARAFLIVPKINLTESWSNNVSLQNKDKQSDFTTQISPGISISSNAGRLRGNFDYSLTQVLYARNSEKNNLQNSLNSTGIYEAIENFAFLEFSGVISQQSISAFGLQSPSNTSINSNKTEVASYRLSPYVRGQFSDLANYEARYSFSTSQSKTSLISDVNTKEASLKVYGNGSGRLRWSIDYNQQDIDYSENRRTQSDRFRGTLTYSLNPQLSASLIGGHEASNYQSADKESHGSVGLSVNWRPSDTTQFSAETERRYFGGTHTLKFEHRTPRTAWTFSDNKGVATSPNQNAAGLGGLYDLLFSQFASIEPDPIRRAQLVNAFLQSNGLDPRAQPTLGYLTSSQSIQRSQALTFALLGIRDTITFTALRSNGHTLGITGVPSDDFALSPIVRQNGLNINYSHRLTPDSNLAFMFSQQESSGASNISRTTQRLFNLSLSTRIGLKAYANVAARRVISVGDASYTETAITGSLNVQF